MKRRLLLACLVLGLLLAPGLRAQVGLESAWRTRLHDIDRHLRAGKYRAAQRESRRLAHQMVEGLGTGQSAAYTLAVTCAFRAIAERGLGNDADASWYWWTAHRVFPDITKADLSPYGEPARALQEEKFRARDGKPELVDWSTKGLKPPVITKKNPPSYPSTLLHMGVRAVYVAQVVVEPDGSLTGPLVFQSAREPAMVYVVLEAIHHWHFEPATLDGHPVPCLHMVTVNFKINGLPTSEQKTPPQH
jgi:hypothetical protein